MNCICLCAVLKHIHDLSLIDGCYHIVNHRRAHHLINILHGTVERCCLHQIVHARTLLALRLLVDGDKL